MNTEALYRRRFLQLAAPSSASVVAAGATSTPLFAAEAKREVNANEDLMREHGVLRRALLVYRAAAGRLVSDTAKVPADALTREDTIVFTAWKDALSEQAYKEMSEKFEQTDVHRTARAEPQHSL